VQQSLTNAFAPKQLLPREQHQQLQPSSGQQQHWRQQQQQTHNQQLPPPLSVQQQRISQPAQQRHIPTHEAVCTVQRALQAMIV
jgi:hypothetical protein